MDNFTFQVDLKGIIRLLSDNLYSDDRVFLRELLQNAVDALAARRLEQPGFTGDTILVCLKNEGKASVLEFSDNGIGLTREEIHEFLSVIGKSSKRENELRGSFIGQFGIGLLSCFLVADTIEVHTRSGRAETGYAWLGKSDGEYSIAEDSARLEQGTTVRLRFTPHMQSKYTYEQVCSVLAEYGYLIPTPIEVQSDKQTACVNDNYIPWRESFYTTGTALEFGECIFHRTFFDVVPIQGEGLVGFAYIINEPGSARNILHHKIYQKDMFITEDGRELVPSWAFFVQCVLNTDNLTPIASREGFYRDGRLLKAKAMIEQCLIEYFVTTSQIEPQKLGRFTQIHNLAIKALALENDKVFQIFFPFLFFNSSKGLITGNQLVATAKQQPVYYCVDIDTYRKLKPIVESEKFLLINAGYIYDASLVERAKRSYKGLRLGRLSDDEIGNVLEQVTPEEESRYGNFLKLANETLRPLGCAAEVRRFMPTELNSLFVPGTNGLLIAMEDIQEETEEEDTLSFLMEGFGEDLTNMGYSHLYLNANSQMIQRLCAIEDSEMAHTFGEVLYLQAMMMGSYPLGTKEMRILNQDLTRLITFGMKGLEEL